MQPNFERFRKVLLRKEEPDYVPLGDISVHPILKEAILGRPVRTLEDDVAFWGKAGYDHVPLEQGFQLTDVIRKQSMRTIEANYAFGTSEMQTRSWATEGKGLITTMKDFESFRWPDPDSLDYSAFEKVKSYLPPQVKVIAILGKIYTSIWWLMGLEGMSLSFADEPTLVPKLFEKIGKFQFRVFENMLKFNAIGAFWHADDIAYSTQLMVNPKILRQHLFPWYKEMNRVAHEKGRLVVYHSDGNIHDVIEDIIGCGFDGLNPIEPKAMNINELKKKFGSRISLIGNIDLGYTLTRGTPEEVKAEVRQRIHDLAPGGGYAVASSNSVPEYVPLANYNAMREATFQYGKYPISA